MKHFFFHKCTNSKELPRCKLTFCCTQGLRSQYATVHEAALQPTAFIPFTMDSLRHLYMQDATVPVIDLHTCALLLRFVAR